MREVIQKVIATETEAKQLVQAARIEADLLVSSARLQARDVVEQMHRDAKVETEKILAAAETDAAREKTERLTRAAVEIETDIRLDETTAQQAVETALRCLCGFSSDDKNSP